MQRTFLRWALTISLLACVWGGAWWAVPLTLTLMAVAIELNALMIGAQEQRWHTLYDIRLKGR